MPNLQHPSCSTWRRYAPLLLAVLVISIFIVETHATDGTGASNRQFSSIETLEIAQADQRAQILRLQQQLADLGYAPGGADGVIGPNTQRAIASFQRDAGLPVSGLPGVDTLASIQAVWMMRGGAGLRESRPSSPPTSPVSPSFDCARAGNAPERAICSSPELAQLDRQMADYFRQARDALGGRSADEVRTLQRAWLGRRDQCGSNQACLADSMRQQIQVLAIYAGQNTSPGNDTTQFNQSLELAPQPRTPSSLGLGTPETMLEGTDGKLEATSSLPEGLQLNFATPGQGTGLIDQTQADTVVPGEMARSDGQAFSSQQMPIGTPPADVALPIVQGLPSYFLGFVARDERFADDDAIAERHAQLHLRMALSADVTPEIRQAQQIAALGYLERSAIEQTFLSLMGEMPRTWASFINQQPSAARVSAALSVWITPGQSPVATHTEFQARRFAQAFLPQADQWMARAALPVRQRVLFVCPFELPSYDFDLGRFVLNVEQVRGDCLGTRQATSIASVPMPGAVDTGATVGDLLSSAQQERGRLLLSFPGTLTIATASDWRGAVSYEYEIAPEGPFSLVRGSNADDVLYTFSEDELVSPPLSREAQAAADLVDFDRPWSLSIEAEREVLLGRALRVGEEAPSVTSMFAQPTGLRLRHVNSLYHSEVSSSDANMGDFYLPQHRGNGRDTVASRFGVDVDQVLSLNDAVSAGPSATRAFLLFAAPLDEFPPQPLPPLEPDGTNTPIYIDYIVSGEYSYAEAGGRNVLVFAVQPAHMTSFVRRGAYNDETRLYEDVTLGSVPMVPAPVAQFALRQITKRSDILYYLAQQQGASLADFAFEAYTRARVMRDDPFARRELAEQLATQLRERPAPDGRFQLVQPITLQDYDFETQSFPIRREGRILVADDDSTMEQLAVGWGLDGDSWDLRLPMPPEAARSLQSSVDSHPSYLAVLDVRATGEWVSNGDPAIDIAVDAITLLRASADLRVDNPTDTLLRFDYGAWLAERTRAASQEQAAIEAQLDGVRFDILDLYIGMDLEQAVARADAAIGAQARYFSTRQMRQSYQGGDYPRYLAQPVLDWSSFHEAIVLTNGDETDTIVLYHEPPYDSERVTTITRSRHFAPGQGPTPEILSSLLNEKYAADSEALRPGHFTTRPPSTIGPDGRRVFDPEVRDCHRQISVNHTAMFYRSVLFRDRAEGYFPPEFSPFENEDGERWLPRKAYPVELFGFMPEEVSCPGDYFYSWYLEGADGFISEFHSVLINFEAVTEAFQANRLVATEPLQSSPGANLEL